MWASPAFGQHHFGGCRGTRDAVRIEVRILKMRHFVWLFGGGGGGGGAECSVVVCGELGRTPTAFGLYSAGRRVFFPNGRSAAEIARRPLADRGKAANEVWHFLPSEIGAYVFEFAGGDFGSTVPRSGKNWRFASTITDPEMRIRMVASFSAEMGTKLYCRGGGRGNRYSLFAGGPTGRKLNEIKVGARGLGLPYCFGGRKQVCM